MTVEWRALGTSEVDHAQLWSLVSCATAGLVGVAVFQGVSVDLVCPFRALTGIPCPTCGATRALAALASGRFVEAVRLNPLVVALLVLGALYLVYAALVTLTSKRRLHVRFTPYEWNRLRVLTLAATLATWVFLIVDRR